MNASESERKTRSAIMPAPSPKTTWSMMSRVMVELCRARSPSAAEEKIARPPSASVRTRMKKSRSPERLILFKERDGHAQYPADDRDDPVAHGHLVGRPADRF